MTNSLTVNKNISNASAAFDNIEEDTRINATILKKLLGFTLTEITFNTERDGSQVLSYPIPVNQVGEVTEFNSAEVPEVTAVYFYRDNGTCVAMYHNQDCCESVRLLDVDGDMNDLIGTPILEAEEVTQKMNNPRLCSIHGDPSGTWTFYKLGTRKGSVVLRWEGTSNGNYSEDVDVRLVKNKGRRHETIPATKRPIRIK